MAESEEQTPRGVVVVTPEVGVSVDTMSLAGAKFEAPGSNAFTDEGDGEESSSSVILVDGGSALFDFVGSKAVITKTASEHLRCLSGRKEGDSGSRFRFPCKMVRRRLFTMLKLAAERNTALRLSKLWP